MAIGFNNMKFTDNLAKGSLSMMVRGLTGLEGRDLKQEHNQLLQEILL